MKNEDFKLEVVKKLTKLEVTAKNTEKHLIKLNGTVKDHDKRMDRHDVIFGRIGVIITSGIFLISIGINFVIDFVKDKIIK